MNEKLLSLVDVVKVNPELMNQIRTRDLAVTVLNHLLEMKVSIAQLVECTCHYRFGDELLGIIAARFRPTEKWFEFVEAVYARAREFAEEGVWSIEMLCDLMSEPQTIEYLLTHHRQSLLDSCEPISIRHADRYWRWKVGWYIVKEDFRRAWDELKKASRGFFTGKVSPGSYYSPDDYCDPASSGAIRSLVDELFASMVQRNLIEGLTESDHTVSPYQGHYTVISRKGKVVDKQYSVDGSAAWTMAKEFLVRSGDWYNRQSLFSETGAKILKIDVHFRKLRDADRRRRIMVKMETGHK